MLDLEEVYLKSTKNPSQFIMVSQDLNHLPLVNKAESLAVLQLGKLSFVNEFQRDFLYHV